MMCARTRCQSLSRHVSGRDATLWEKSSADSKPFDYRSCWEDRGWQLRGVKFRMIHAKCHVIQLSPRTLWREILKKASITIVLSISQLKRILCRSLYTVDMLTSRTLCHTRHTNNAELPRFFRIKYLFRKVKVLAEIYGRGCRALLLPLPPEITQLSLHLQNYFILRLARSLTAVFLPQFSLLFQLPTFFSRFSRKNLSDFEELIAYHRLLKWPLTAHERAWRSFTNCVTCQS